jgi:putative peptidoglycan lipid II flippase
VIRTLFSAQSKTITGAAMLLGAAGFLSRIIGLLRDRLLAHTFGAGPTLDAYYAAFRIPDTVYTLLIVGALGAGFIPIVTKLTEEHKKRAEEVTSAILSMTLLALGLTSLVALLFSVPLVTWLTPGFTADQRDLTLELTRIMLLSPLILGASGIIGNILQIHKLFRVYALTPIAYNIGIMLGTIAFVPVFGAAGLGYGVILGALFHLAIQLPSIYRLGFKFHPHLTLALPEVRAVFSMMIPRLFSLGASQGTLLYITSLASTVSVGALTVFTFANNVQYMPIGMVALSFAVAAFPTLSELMAKNDLPAFRTQVSQTAGQILFFLFPLTAILILLRAQIIRVALGSGAFDWRATIETADALAFFAISLFAQGLIPLLARAHFARENTRLPLVAAVVGAILTIALAKPCVDLLGIPGLALAFSLGAIVQCAVLWTTLRRAIGTLHERMRFMSLLKISIATMGMGVVIQYLKSPLAYLVDMTRFWGIFTQGFLCGLAGLLAYAGLSYLLRTEEMLRLLQSLNKRFVNVRHVPSAPPTNETLT